MDRDAWLGYFDNAPAPVRFYLMNSKSQQGENQAQQNLAYDEDAWPRVMDVVWEVLFEHLTKAEFRQQLKALAGDRKPEDLEREVLLRIVFPLADMVAWDVDSRLLELGVPSTVLQNAFRISLRPVSYGAAARRIATQAHLSVLTEEIARRLRELIVSYVKGVRGTEEVIEVLQRKQEEGGVGFTREQADAYVKEMEEFLTTTQVMSEEAYGEWFTTYQREMSAIQAARDHAPTQAGSSGPKTEEQEIAEHAVITPTKAEDPSLQSGIDLAFSRINRTDLDEYLHKRLENVISTRLRDVRNLIQVREILLRDAKVGGMGFDAAEAERITNIIETIYLETRTQIAQEEKVKIDAIKQEQTRKMEERRKRESEEHAAWYQEKVRDQSPEAGWEALKALRDQAVTQGTEASVKPTMDSVRAPTRLTSLSEEFGTLTLGDFRRIGRTPEQAVEKLSQKFETLKQESFERWSEGVQAWRSSPLQQLYLRLVADSFATGKPVAQLAEERRQQNQDVPTPEELGAIMQLNSHVQT
jgi:hypothetical protein